MACFGLGADIEIGILEQGPASWVGEGGPGIGGGVELGCEIGVAVEDAVIDDTDVDGGS